MEMKHCYSCSMPLVGADGEKIDGDYCQYCVDEKGNLKPREQVQQGMAEWLKSWGPKDESIDYMKRAESYMKGLPAWADK